jgi:hypothetical protein
MASAVQLKMTHNVDVKVTGEVCRGGAQNVCVDVVLSKFYGESRDW